MLLDKVTPDAPEPVLSETRDRRFRDALDEVASVIGSKYLVTNPETVHAKSQDIIPKTQAALAFAYPGSTEEIQAICKIANRHLLPLWPVSKGRNWGYGAASPARGPALVLVLERMNRIIEVNTELAYTVVEPGVSFRQLHAYLVEKNIPLWLDCTDGPADGSVVGNALERGIGETDYGDHFGNACGLEAVLPDGSLLQSGGGPHNAHRSWNTYKWGVGPYIEGLFSQSNFGIVTKMGMWLRPKPEYFSSCLFDLRREADFPLLIDGLRKLQLHGVLQSKVHLINEVATRAVAADHHLNENVLQGYHFCPWTFAAGLYGTRAQVKADIQIIKKTLGPLGRLEFVDDRKLTFIKTLIQWLTVLKSRSSLRSLSDWISRVVIGKPLSLMEILPYVHSIEKGCPSDFFVKHAYFKSKIRKPRDNNIDPVRDQCGLIWMGPMVPLKGNDVQEFICHVKPLFEKYGFEMYVALMVGNPRTAIVLLSIFYDKTDQEESRKAEELYFEIGAVTQKLGYQQYRTSTLFMDKILQPAPEFRDFCVTLKRSIDPNGIMAPGKYGI